MAKSIRIQEALSALMGAPTDGSCCMVCKTDKVKDEDFRDDMSHREFVISLTCQECQDRIFQADTADLYDEPICEEEEEGVEHGSADQILGSSQVATHTSQTCDEQVASPEQRLFKPQDVAGNGATRGPI